MTLLVMCALLAAHADSNTYSGRDNQTRVAPPRIEADVTINGVLDEPPWAQAASLIGFSAYAPVDGRPAASETEVRLWYSPTALYVGIHAHAEAGSVRATLANRDHIEADDWVQIFLDTFNDRRQALMFGVNPLGVQADGALAEGTKTTTSSQSALLAGREAADLSPDFVFQSKGRITEEGFDVEVRIPFKTLRFPPARTQSWGIHVIRRVQRLGHEDSWVPARRDSSSFLGQAGTLEHLTDLRRGIVLDVNPVVTARVDGAPRAGAWDYDGDRPEFGVNLKWGVTTNLTLNGTVNPDFSQVEADAGQFVFDPRQALYFAEKRPFFLDGIEQFSTPNQLIYTRRIVAPLGAARLTGKVGSTRVAFLSAVDDSSASWTQQHHPFINLFRVQHDLGNESRLGIVYTDRIDGNDYNRVASIDARVTFNRLYAVQVQGAVSRTRRNGAVTTAPLWDGVFSRNGRTFGFRYQLKGIHPDFRASSGFISRGAIAYGVAEHRLTLYGSRGTGIESWAGTALVDGFWNYRQFVAGRGAQDRRLHLKSSFALRGGWSTGSVVMIESFGYDKEYYADYAVEWPTPNGVEARPFVGTPALRNLDFEFTLNTPAFSGFSGSVFYLFGRDDNFFEWSPADIVFASVSGKFRPTDQLRLEAGYQLQQYKRRSDGSIVGVRKIPRLRVEYQLTRSIFLRLIGEYDANWQDDLRDDSRTNFPLLIRNSATGAYERAEGSQRNVFRTDWLFSYQPTPGTVIFAGYGSLADEPLGLRFSRLRRTSDGFFLKVSYLFRL